MENISAEIIQILSTSIFKKIINNDLLTIKQINAATTLLIKAGIPFDLSFSPGTRREATAAELTIYINPTTTLNFTISFEGGGSIFGGNES